VPARRRARDAHAADRTRQPSAIALTWPSATTVHAPGARPSACSHGHHARNSIGTGVAPRDPLNREFFQKRSLASHILPRPPRLQELSRSGPQHLSRPLQLSFSPRVRRARRAHAPPFARLPHGYSAPLSPRLNLSTCRRDHPALGGATYLAVAALGAARDAAVGGIKGRRREHRLPLSRNAIRARNCYAAEPHSPISSRPAVHHAHLTSGVSHNAASRSR
jgi:hypothetical protein